MAAKLKTKRTSITTMGAKIQAFDIFRPPLNSHYPLPLNKALKLLQEEDNENSPAILKLP
jgi:hypothetical protein